MVAVLRNLDWYPNNSRPRWAEMSPNRESRGSRYLLQVHSRLLSSFLLQVAKNPNRTRITDEKLGRLNQLVGVLFRLTPMNLIPHVVEQLSMNRG